MRNAHSVLRIRRTVLPFRRAELEDGDAVLEFHRAVLPIRRAVLPDGAAVPEDDATVLGDGDAERQDGAAELPTNRAVPYGIAQVGRRGPPEKDTMSDTRLTTERALAACEAITKHASPTSNPFNLDADMLSSIQSAHDALATLAEDQRLTALVLKGKVTAKDVALAGAGRILGTATKIALSSYATDAQLRTIGLARPAKPTRPTSIPAPTDLVVSAQGMSKAKLAFGRNGAPYGTAYEVFGSPDGFAFEFLATTTRASLLVDQTPGVAAWYKIRAVRAGLISEFSNTASIYAPSDLARVQLKVA